MSAAAHLTGESWFPPLEEDRQRLGPDVEDDAPYVEWLKEMRGWLLVVATVVATCAYTSSVAPPGGFWQEDKEEHVAGTAILEDKSPGRFVVFRLFNSFALAQSFAIIIIVMRKTAHSKGSKSLVRALQVLTVCSIASLSIAHATITLSYHLFKIDVIYLVVVFLILAEFISRLQPAFSKLGSWVKKTKHKYLPRRSGPNEQENRAGKWTRKRILWFLVLVGLRIGVIVALVTLSVKDSRYPGYWGNWHYKIALFTLVPFGLLLWWFGM